LPKNCGIPIRKNPDTTAVIIIVWVKKPKKVPTKETTNVILSNVINSGSIRKSMIKWFQPKGGEMRLASSVSTLSTFPGKSDKSRIEAKTILKIERVRGDFLSKMKSLRSLALFLRS